MPIAIAPDMMMISGEPPPDPTLENIRTIAIGPSAIGTNISTEL